MARAKRDDHTIKDGRTLPIFIHSTIDDMTQLSPNDMRVYMHLSRRADKSGAAWPSYQSIGDHCFATVYKHADVRRRRAVESIAALVKAGLLKKEKRLTEHGQQSNQYILIDPVTVESQPGVTQESQPGGTAKSQGYSIVESQPAVTVGYPDPVTVESPKDSPIEGSPKRGNGIIPSSEPWAKCLAELLPTMPGVAQSYLTGSRLEVADNLPGSLPIYRVIVEARAAVGVEWLMKQCRHSISRTLSSILGKSVLIEIVAAPQVAPAATPELEPTP